MALAIQGSARSRLRFVRGDVSSLVLAGVSGVSSILLSRGTTIDDDGR
jgi:hypothetical protein